VTHVGACPTTKFLASDLAQPTSAAHLAAVAAHLAARAAHLAALAAHFAALAVAAHLAAAAAHLAALAAHLAAHAAHFAAAAAEEILTESFLTSLLVSAMGTLHSQRIELCRLQLQ
jgi:hypothetical protein